VTGTAPTAFCDRISAGALPWGWKGGLWGIGGDSGNDDAAVLPASDSFDPQALQCSLAAGCYRQLGREVPVANRLLVAAAGAFLHEI
jgi:hypothetical protein